MKGKTNFIILNSILLLFTMNTEEAAVIPHITTQEEMDAVLAKEEYTLVEYYIPDCQYCKQLQPELDQLNSNKKVPLYQINCSEPASAPICSAQSIQGYPTLKFMSASGTCDYSGARKAADIESYYEKLSSYEVSWSTISSSEVDSTIEAHKAASKESTEENKSFLAVFHSASASSEEKSKTESLLRCRPETKAYFYAVEGLPSSEEFLYSYESKKDAEEDEAGSQDSSETRMLLNGPLSIGELLSFNSMLPMPLLEFNVQMLRNILMLRKPLLFMLPGAIPKEDLSLRNRDCSTECSAIECPKEQLEACKTANEDCRKECEKRKEEKNCEAEWDSYSSKEAGEGEVKLEKEEFLKKCSEEKEGMVCSKECEGTTEESCAQECEENNKRQCMFQCEMAKQMPMQVEFNNFAGYEKVFKLNRENRLGNPLVALVLNEHDETHKNFVKMLGLREEGVGRAVILMENKEGTNFEKFRLEEDISEESLKRFLDDVQKGKAPVFYKSAEIPLENDDALKEVVGKNFESFVKPHGEEVVVVLCYVPASTSPNKATDKALEVAEEIAKEAEGIWIDSGKKGHRVLRMGKFDIIENEHKDVKPSMKPTFKAFGKGHEQGVDWEMKEEEGVEGLKKFLKEKFGVSLVHVEEEQSEEL